MGKHSHSATDNARYLRVISRLPDPEDGSRMMLNLGAEKIYRERRLMPVSKGDKVRRINGHGWALKPRKMGKEVRIKPAWRRKQSLNINGEKIPLIIKEIETLPEMHAYESLARFHYRGGKGVGRYVPLLAKFDRWNLPEVAGFVELSSSMLVNVARKKILNAPFYDSVRGIGWKQWDLETAKKYNDVVVRISRCVVYPELRGLGLAEQLTKAAIEYARDRWHIGGMRPSFIEIIAEMLRYWPFVEKCGFVKVGETQGNNKSDPQAMAYLLTRKENNEGYPKGGGGIMSMHRKRAEKLAFFREKRNKSIDDIVKLLSTSPEKLGKENWLLLHDMYRREKPAYMRGLTKSAEDHLRKHAPETPSAQALQSREQPRRVASVRGMNITARVEPGTSQRCRRIQEAFGIVSRVFKSEVVLDFSADFNAGEICLITGASGAGKSLFLEGIRRIIRGGARNFQNIRIKGKNAAAKARVERLRTPPRNQSPIELLSGHSLDDAMRILARAGLAEAQLFVRPTSSMSVGQSYRLSLAVALAKRPDIVIIDEFCEPLDEYTSAAVCRKIRDAAAKDGVCFLVATADARNVRAELRPDRTLLLSAGGGHKFLDARV